MVNLQNWFMKRNKEQSVIELLKGNYQRMVVAFFD